MPPVCRPASGATFRYVHDGLGQTRLAAQELSSVKSALALFRAANELHAHLTGAPSPSALYNMACCESRLHEGGAFARSVAFSSAGASEPLDRAATWLHLACAAGFRETALMQTDPDIAAVRAHRPQKFALALQIAAATAAVMSVEGGSPPLL